MSKLYLDGTLIGSATHGFRAYTSNYGVNTMGRIGNNLKGNMFDMRYYNHAVTYNEVQEIYRNSTILGDELLHLRLFDDDFENPSVETTADYTVTNTNVKAMPVVLPRHIAYDTLTSVTNAPISLDTHICNYKCK